MQVEGESAQERGPVGGRRGVQTLRLQFRQHKGINGGPHPAFRLAGGQGGAFERTQRPPVGIDYRLAVLAGEYQPLRPGGAVVDPLLEVGDLLRSEGNALAGHGGFVAGDLLEQQAVTRLARDEGRPLVAPLEQAATRVQAKAAACLGGAVTLDTALCQQRRDPAREQVIGSGRRAGQQNEAGQQRRQWPSGRDACHRRPSAGGKWSDHLLYVTRRPESLSSILRGRARRHRGGYLDRFGDGSPLPAGVGGTEHSSAMVREECSMREGSGTEPRLSRASVHRFGLYLPARSTETREAERQRAREKPRKLRQRPRPVRSSWWIRYSTWSRHAGDLGRSSGWWISWRTCRDGEALAPGR